MNKISREKIALVVFLALVVFGLGGVIWYMLAGHSWNVTASNIDESVGSMDGYTIILYDGNKTAEETSSSSSSSSSAIASSSSEAASSTSASNSSDANSNAKNSTKTEKDKQPITLSDAAKSYEEKGASVLELDVADASLYKEGTIVKRGNRRIGIISIDVMLSENAQNLLLKPFRDAKVDMIVCITPVKTNMKNVSGVDVTICTEDETTSVLGENRNNNFFVGTPEIGKVGSVLISPSGVVSSKVIDSL